MRTRREKELKPPRTELSKNIGKTQVILLKTGKKNPPKPPKKLQSLAKMKWKPKLDLIQIGARHPSNPPQSRSPLRWKRNTKPFLKAKQQRLLTEWKS